MSQEDIRLFPARSGAPTGSVEGRLLHSKHDPRREARKLVTVLARREPPAVVYLGLGLGYQPAALLAETERTEIVVFEPSSVLLQAAIDAGIVASDPRLHMVGTVSELDHSLSLYARSGYDLVVLRNRFSEDDERLKAARRVLDAFSSRLEINLNTLHRFGRLWVRNLCRNLPALLSGTGVNKVSNLFSDVPALILAAGPTLDQVLPELPRLAERALVIAVDTAVARSLDVGVEPDFSVVVDPQYWNARHLDRVYCSTSLLVSESSAHPNVFRSFRPPYVFCSSVFPLAKRYEDELGRFGNLGAGGSVSTSAWDLARELGCPRAFVAGLDLGFPSGRTHCSGSFFEELALALGNRTHTAEAVIFRYVHGAEPHDVPSNDGGELLSDKRMDIYRAWFESQLPAGNLPTTTLTSGGAAIDGVSVGTHKLLERLPVVRATIDQRISEVRSSFGDTRSESERGVSAVTRQLVRDLESLQRIASSAVKSVQSISQAYAHGGEAKFGLLEAVDQELLHHPAGEIAGFLLQQAINEIDQGFGSKDIGEQLEASHLLYSELLEATEFHLKEMRAIGKSAKKRSKVTGPAADISNG